jgi:hypothetical protein
VVIDGLVHQELGTDLGSAIFQLQGGLADVPEAQGINIIAVYLPPVLSVAIGTT